MQSLPSGKVVGYTGLTKVSMHKGATCLPMPPLRNEQTHKIDCSTVWPEPDPWLCSETSSGARQLLLLPIAQCDITCSDLSSS